MDQTPGRYDYRDPPVPLDELRRTDERSRMACDGGAGESLAGDWMTGTPGPVAGFWAVITDVDGEAYYDGNRYSFIECGVTPDGIDTYLREDMGRTGVHAAKEWNGNAAVPDGAVVWMTHETLLDLDGEASQAAAYRFAFRDSSPASGEDITYDGNEVTLIGVSLIVSASSAFEIKASQTLTINGPGFLIFNAPAKFKDDIFCGYDNLVLTEQFNSNVVLGAKPVTRVTTVTPYSMIAGATPHPNTGTGRMGWLWNLGPGDLYITSDDEANGTPENRFRIGGGETVKLRVDDGANYWYDPVTERWRIVLICCEGDTAEAAVTGSGAPGLAGAARGVGLGIIGAAGLIGSASPGLAGAASASGAGTFGTPSEDVIPGGNAATGTASRYPYGTYYGYERWCLLYPQSRLGGSAATITAVGFYVESLSSPGDAPVAIHMQLTGATVAPTGVTYASVIAASTLVYSGTVLASSLTAGAWVTVTLDTPFALDGTSGLLVCVAADATGTGNESATGKQFRTTSVALSGSAIPVSSVSADSTPPSGALSTYPGDIPNIKLVF